MSSSTLKASALHYGWLAELTDEEQLIGRGAAGNRGVVIEALRDLGGRMKAEFW